MYLQIDVKPIYQLFQAYYIDYKPIDKTVCKRTDKQEKPDK